MRGIVIPSSWRPVLEGSETLQFFFFYYYAVAKAPLSKESSPLFSLIFKKPRCCLVVAASLSLSCQTTVIVRTKSRTSHHCATHRPPFLPPTIYQPLLRLCWLHCLASPNCTASPITSQLISFDFGCSDGKFLESQGFEATKFANDWKSR